MLSALDIFYPNHLKNSTFQCDNFVNKTKNKWTVASDLLNGCCKFPPAIREQSTGKLRQSKIAVCIQLKVAPSKHE